MPEDNQEGRKHFIWIAALVGGAVLLMATIMFWYIGASLFTSSEEEENNSLEIAGDENGGENLKAISGFKFLNKSVAEDPIFTYEHNQTKFSVSLVVSEQSTEVVDEEYSLEPSNAEIKGADVSYAFQNYPEEQGEISAQAYSDLAYGFYYEGEYFSGNISNPEGEPAKEELLDVLREFVSGVVTSVDSVVEK